MAFPTTSVLDDFNRAGPALGANWSADNDNLAIVSSTQAYASGATNYSGSYWNPSTFGPDSEVYYTLSTKPANTEVCWMLLRGVSLGGANRDGYDAVFFANSGTDVIRINRVDNDTETQLGADVSQEFSNGDQFGTGAIGTSISVYRNGTSLASRTDGTYTAAGNIMMGCYGRTIRIDDFGGGTASSGTAYSETAGVIEAWTASAADTRAGVDTSAAILGLVAASSDTRAAVDTGAATLGLTASAADTFSQSDTTAALLGWVASSGDAGAGADTTTAALGWLSAGADTFAQTDTTEAILGWVASGADTFDGGATAYNETAEALLGWAASVSDTFIHSDTAAAELDFSAAAGETYAGFDTASPVIEWTVSASDSTASIDSVMALLGWTASVSDSTVSPDPSRIIVDVFQAGRQVAQANKAVGQKIRKVSG